MANWITKSGKKGDSARHVRITNRFGGENQGGRDMSSQVRRQRLLTAAIASQLDDGCEEVGVSDSRLCPVTDQPIPAGGGVIEGRDCCIKVKALYNGDGKLVGVTAG
jgi:hypothetical protein